MLEVCFNDSVKGALTFAQTCGKDSGSAIGFITDKKGIFSFISKRKALREHRKRQAELQKQAVPLGGVRKDIAGISFGLSEGDIKAPIVFETCLRKDHMYATLSFDRYHDAEDMEQAIDEYWQCSMDDLVKLKSKPEKIRIWLDHTPDAQCGLLFVADLLQGSGAEIHIVELPERVKRDAPCQREYRGWGEVEPQLFGTFVNTERILHDQEIESLSNHWQRLKAENAPLRVVQNGMVISADESYYDALIRKEFPKEACKIATIIGNALVKQKIDTGDVFIAKRIQAFIEGGELAVTENAAQGFYGTIVQAVK